MVSLVLPARPSTIVEQGGQNDSEERAVVGLHDGQLVIEVQALSWLVQYLAAEVISGGVSPVKEKEVPKPDGEGGGVYWDFQNSRWIATARSSDGVWCKKHVAIKKRMKDDLKHLDFQAK